jgi:para-aminobenzoate synthetase/4-amino-4-deoxychorismate lyase
MQPASPETPDPSLGVFETMLVRDGRAQALGAHLERLASSVSELYRLELPPDLQAATAERAAALGGEHRLRVDAVPQGAGLGIEFQTSRLEPAGGGARLICKPVVVPGGLGSHKWSDRRLLDQLGDGGSVPLLVDRNGDVLEAGWANLWLLEAGRLVTPPADGRLLPGVTRARLLALAPSLGLDALEERISITRARAATETFLTSSLRLAAVVALERQPSSAGEESVVKTIRGALSRSSWD